MKWDGQQFRERFLRAPQSPTPRHPGPFTTPSMVREQAPAGAQATRKPPGLY